MSVFKKGVRIRLSARGLERRSKSTAGFGKSCSPNPMARSAPSTGTVVKDQSAYEEWAGTILIRREGRSGNTRAFSAFWEPIPNAVCE